MRRVFLLILAVLLPTSIFAADNVSSKLTNQTKQNDPAGQGYILEQVATWGNNCIVDKESLAKTLNPGESTTLKITKDCEWAGVRYKVLKDNQTIGFVGDSYSNKGDNKGFSLEVSLACQGEECNFTGLPPSDASKK